MAKRSGYRMVADDDPQFLRFWNLYPLRVSKKDARKAWAALNPSPELVERMLTAIAWQAPLWAKQGYGTPYPATWLNKEKWTDEPPIQVRRAMSEATETVFRTLGMKPV